MTTAPITYRVEVVVTRNGEELARELITEQREEDGWACGHAYWRTHEVAAGETFCDWCAGNDGDPTIRPVRIVTCELCGDAVLAMAFAEHVFRCGA
jgi:hypothetical protein